VNDTVSDFVGLVGEKVKLAVGAMFRGSPTEIDSSVVPDVWLLPVTVSLTRYTAWVVKERLAVIPCAVVPSPKSHAYVLMTPLWELEQDALKAMD
jgi:hypothetical protein